VVRYAEWPGSRGFAIELRFGEGIDIVASPLLRDSPHVLYTNVVEPVLRWSFVERGFALVHGACVAVDGQAFLITARTDTGKTTTMLRVLDSQPDYAFLSDDLSLVSPDGRVLTYPKPLTISRHTLVAVNTPLLSWSERLGLFVQSRVHSRSGRRFGLLLTKSRLPMATTNAVVQRLIPPPKYHVERLVPHARVAQVARLAGMIVIERGDGGEVRLDESEALKILMANCEDSYGFPPYDAIEESLYWSNGRDLREVERRIVAAAFEDCPAILMRSATRSWWQMLPDFIGGALAARLFPPTTAEPAPRWATEVSESPAD
jgi:dolichol-phosphate mannosyltransferase